MTCASLEKVPLKHTMLSDGRVRTVVIVFHERILKMAEGVPASFFNSVLFPTCHWVLRAGMTAEQDRASQLGCWKCQGGMASRQCMSCCFQAVSVLPAVSAACFL